MTTRLTNLPVPFTFQFPVTVSGTPEKLQVKRRVTTIAFSEGSGETPSVALDAITDSASGFLQAGFQPGDLITVESTSGLNDGTYTISSVTAGTIRINSDGDLTTETAVAAGTVKITTSKSVPDGVGVTIKAMYANGGTVTVGYSSASALNTGVGCFKLRNNESLGLQVHDIGDLWVDATVSGEGLEVIFEKQIQE
ncbi:MAG: hypothetical protein NUV80_04655 [Candidatus Berkelbacteria bacterium]|nr:hypothetical protein [Candidatus Berkelbacteria bacterium]